MRYQVLYLVCRGIFRGRTFKVGGAQEEARPLQTIHTDRLPLPPDLGVSPQARLGSTSPDLIPCKPFAKSNSHGNNPRIALGIRPCQVRSHLTVVTLDLEISSPQSSHVCRSYYVTLHTRRGKAALKRTHVQHLKRSALSSSSLHLSAGERAICLNSTKLRSSLEVSTSSRDSATSSNQGSIRAHSTRH